jgi:hypothetical protein
MILKIILSVLFAIFISAVQLLEIPQGGFYFNFVLAAVVALAYAGFAREASVFGGAAGLVLDFYSMEKFGFFSVLFFLTAVLLVWVMSNFFTSKNWFSFLFFSVFAAASFSSFFLLLKAFFIRGISGIDFYSFVSRCLEPSFATAVLLSFGYLIFCFLKRKRF